MRFSYEVLCFATIRSESHLDESAKGALFFNVFVNILFTCLFRNPLAASIFYMRVYKRKLTVVI